jgi:hypothetical protein
VDSSTERSTDSLKIETWQELYMSCGGCFLTLWLTCNEIGWINLRPGSSLTVGLYLGLIRWDETPWVMFFWEAIFLTFCSAGIGMQTLISLFWTWVDNWCSKANFDFRKDFFVGLLAGGLLVGLYLNLQGEGEISDVSSLSDKKNRSIRHGAGACWCTSC